MPMSRTRFSFTSICLVAALLLSAAGAIPASAQQVLVQNGATVEVSNDGVWDLQGATMDLGPAGATATLSEQSGGRVDNGPLTATRALNNPSSSDPAGLGIAITTSADLGDVTVTRGHAVQTAPNGNASIRRYYDLSPSQTNSGLDAELTFSYADAELNGRTESELEFFKSTDGGSTWSEEGLDSQDTSGNTVTLGGIESLSRWTLGSESSPLPVDLIAFEGAVTDQGVTLTWRTATETDNAGFEVERTTPGARTWDQIGFLEGQGPGTTHATTAYTFTDDQIPYEADSLRYRLTQVDLGGTQSEAFAPLSIALRAPDQLTLHDSAPNPFSHRTTLRYELPQARSVRLAVYDLLGRRVKTLVAERQRAGRHQVRLYAQRLASGTYLVRLSTGRHTRTVRVTVSR